MIPYTENHEGSSTSRENVRPANPQQVEGGERYAASGSLTLAGGRAGVAIDTGRMMQSYTLSPRMSRDVPRYSSDQL